MIKFFFCKSFEDKIRGISSIDIVKNKIKDYSNYNDLKNIEDITSYKDDIFILKTYKPKSVIIIEKRSVNLADETIEVHFIRDIIIGQNVDYLFSRNILPQLKSKTWKSNNEIAKKDIKSFINEYNNTKNYDSQLIQLPNKYTSWFNDFQLKLDNEVFETEEWVKYALSNSKKDGMYDKIVDTFRNVLKDIIINNNAKSDILTKINGINIYKVIKNDIGIIYSVIDINKKQLYFLINGAHVIDQKDRWNQILQEPLNYQIELNKDTISRISFRAYPKWTLKNLNLWFSIEKSNELSNLSLTKEQISFFHNFKFPYYINGQAGSGKSTMLYYIFSNVFWYKIQGEIQGDIIFLTENKQLLDKTKEYIIDLLTNNPEFEISTDNLGEIDNQFSSFRDFLHNLIPTNDIDKFPLDKYLSFSKFKRLYEDSNIDKKYINKFSAEEIWFTIITYIYGYSENKVTSVDYETIVDRDAKIISLNKFKIIEKEILPFYEKLIIEEGYWDKLKIIRYINENIKVTNRYTVLICDEAQDFCNVELKFILKLSKYLQYDLSETKQVPIVFAGDPNQTVNPTGFRQDEMKSMLYKELKLNHNFNFEPNEKIYNPRFNYRSSQPVVSLANFIQYHRLKKLGITQVEPQEAKRPDYDIDYNFNIFLNFDTIKNNVEIEADLLNKLKFKIFIIPVDSQDKEKYIKNDNFLNKLKDDVEIKTSVEAKGAEYKHVVLYGFGKYFIDNYENLTEQRLEIDEQFDRRYFYNKLYVGVTRAQSELVIIDSKESEQVFWRKLVNEASITTEKWTVLNEYRDKTIEYNTDSVNIVQSTKEDAEENAKKDKKQGLYDENPARLRVAANQFNKIGNKEESYDCLALSEKLKENWKAAANYYLNPVFNNRKLNEAADCLLKGRFFKELLSFDNIKSIKHDIRITLSRIFVGEPLTQKDISTLKNGAEELVNIINELDWKIEIAPHLIIHIKKNDFKENKKVLIHILKTYIPIQDETIWEEIGDIYYELEDFKNAIDSWNKINYIDNEKYVLSKCGIAKANNNFTDLILWLGELIKFKSKEEAHKIYDEILQVYQKNNFQIENQYLYLVIYEAAIIKNKTNLILEIGKKTEKSFTNSLFELERFYKSIIHNSTDEIIKIFLLERWAKTTKKIYNAINNDKWLIELNTTYSKLAKEIKISFEEFTIEELNNIPDLPEIINVKPSNHFNNYTVNNFRQFNQVSINNIGQFNLIVGDNNVGKTTILESLLFSSNFPQMIENLFFSFISRKNISKTIINSKETYEFDYTEIFNDFCKNDKTIKEIIYTLSTKRTNFGYTIRNAKNDEISERIGIVDNIDTSEFISVLFDNKLIDVIELKLLYRKLKPTSIIKSPLIPFGRGFDVDLAKVYYDEIDKIKAKREAFLNSIRAFIPNINRIVVDTESGQIDIEEDGMEISAPLYQYGEGANKLFRILVQMTLQKNNKILIDEIDAGIHYSRFPIFWKTIINAALENNVQIFATTHNIECVKYFKDTMESDEYSNYQNKSRVITIEKISTNTDKFEVFTRTFDEFQYEIERNFEIRGGDF